MSVIIKGMEMPENCVMCSIKAWDEDGYVCPFSGIMCLNIGRQADCPLVELPEKHGRLIDADDAMVTLSSALEKAIREKDDTTAFTIGAIEGFLKASPAVIEAEE